MANQLHRNIETAYNATKLIAILVVGAWTYYQWDRVIFPKEDFDQRERLSTLRADLDVEFGSIGARLLATPETGSDFEGLRIVELSGAIGFTNSRPFPVRLDLAEVTLVLNRQPDIDTDSSLQMIEYSDSIGIEIDGHYAFGGALSEGLVIENGGQATVSFRVPVVLNAADISAPHDLVFGAKFDLSPVSPTQGDTAVDQQKTKLVFASILIGESETEATPREEFVATAANFPVGIEERLEDHARALNALTQIGSIPPDTAIPRADRQLMNAASIEAEELLFDLIRLRFGDDDFLTWTQFREAYERSPNAVPEQAREIVSRVQSMADSLLELPR